MKKIRIRYIQAFLLLLGVSCLALSGLNWHFALPVWIGHLLLLRYSRDAKKIGMLILFLMLAVSGAISQTGSNVFGRMEVNFSNGISFGILVLLFYLPDKLLFKKLHGFHQTLIFPLSVVLVEFGVSRFAGTWGIITHTQYPFKALLQLCYPAGPFSVSFLVAWTASTLNWIYENKTNGRKPIVAFSFYILAFLSLVFYGTWRLGRSTCNSPVVNCAAIRGVTDLHGEVRYYMENILLEAKEHDISIPDEIFSRPKQLDTMLSRTQEALEHGAKIVAWNESALILDRNYRNLLLDSLSSLAANYASYILPAFLELADDGPKPANNIAVLIGPDGKQLLSYKKSYLHPLAEAPLMNPGDFKLPCIQTEYGRVGLVICVDADIPYLMRQARKKDIDLMLIPSYDWPGINPLHAQMAVVTAITNNFSMLRPNGNGTVIAYNRQKVLQSDKPVAYFPLCIK